MKKHQCVDCNREFAAAQLTRKKVCKGCIARRQGNKLPLPGSRGAKIVWERGIPHPVAPGGTGETLAEALRRVFGSSSREKM